MDSVSQSLNSFLLREQTTKPRENEERAELTPGSLDSLEQHNEPSDPNETTATAEPSVTVNLATPDETADEQEGRVPLSPNEIVFTGAAPGAFDPEPANGTEKQPEDAQDAPEDVSAPTEDPARPAAPKAPQRPQQQVNPDGLDMFRDCLTQTVSLMRPHEFVVKDRNGDVATRTISKPGIGSVTQEDVDALEELSRTKWPEADPRRGALSILRACGSTQEYRQKMQENALRYSGVLSISGLRRLDREVPMAFFTERMSEAVEPFKLTCGPDPALAEAIRDLSDPRYHGDKWFSCWLEASAICATVGMDPVVFAACTKLRLTNTPFPWTFNHVALDLPARKVGVYKEDRFAAWQGSAPPHAEDKAYPVSVGAQLASAAFKYRNSNVIFKCRTCLRCAAAELKHHEGLTRALQIDNSGRRKLESGWAKELAATLDKWADGATDDILPHRSGGCGFNNGEDACSFFQCPHADAVDDPAVNAAAPLVDTLGEIAAPIITPSTEEASTEEVSQ